MLPGLGLGGLATVARLVQTPMGWPLPALGDRAARSWALPPDISSFLFHSCVSSDFF